jgi:hypothetical protein
MSQNGLPESVASDSNAQRDMRLGMLEAVSCAPGALSFRRWAIGAPKIAVQMEVCSSALPDFGHMWSSRVSFS